MNAPFEPIAAAAATWTAKPQLIDATPLSKVKHSLIESVMRVRTRDVAEGISIYRKLEFMIVSYNSRDAQPTIHDKKLREFGEYNLWVQ